MIAFVEKGKLEYPEKNLLEQSQNQQTKPTYAVEFRNQSPSTLVEGKSSHHCTNPAAPPSTNTEYKIKDRGCT